MIKKVYRTNELGLLGITKTGEIIDGLSVATRSLSAVNEAFPIQYLRQVNDSLLYVVYKVVSEDEQPYNIYLFFEKLDSVTEQIKEDTELWWLTGRVLYAAKSLSSNDFKQIVAGTS